MNRYLGLFIGLALLPMIPAGEGGGSGSGGAVDEIEVDLPGGVKLKLPKDQAQKVIAGRDTTKEELRKANERLGALDAEKRAAEDAKTAAEREKAALEAAKAGDMAKVKELHTAELTAERTKISGKLRDKGLQATIGGNTKIVPAAVADIVEQLRGRFAYDFESDSLIVLDAAGQPVKDTAGKTQSVDSFLEPWLAQRPHYLLDGTPPGSGAAKGGNLGKSPGKISQADYDAAAKDPARAQVVAAQVMKGELVVV
jgi:hypothetical protein